MITLTLKNAESLTELAALTGWTADELANHLLAETFEGFANEFSGSLEGFLGAIDYPDRASAQCALDRVTGITRGQLPDSFKTEISEHQDGRFDFRVEYIDRLVSDRIY